MSQMTTILRREYMDRVRRRSFLIGTILGPVLLLGVTFIPGMLAVRSVMKSYHIALVDRTGRLAQEMAHTFTDSLPDGTPRHRFTIPESALSADEAKLRKDLESRTLAGEFNGVLWLPASILEGDTARYYAQNLGDPEMAEQMRGSLTRAAMRVRLSDRGLPAAEADEIARRTPLKVLKLTKEGVQAGGFEGDFIAGIAFAMILYMTILLYGVSVQRSVLEDKSSRITEVLLSTTRPYPIMLGKVLGVGGVGLTQYMIWAVAAALVASYLRASQAGIGQYLQLSPTILVLFVLYFVLGYLLYAALYAAIGAMANSEQEAQQMQWFITPLLILPMLMLSMFIRNPDSPTSVIMSLIPFFTPTLMMVRTSIHMPPLWQVGVSIALLAVSVFGMTWVAARVFRVGILMYGKRPTLPELLRWVRQS